MYYIPAVPVVKILCCIWAVYRSASCDLGVSYSGYISDAGVLFQVHMDLETFPPAVLRSPSFCGIVFVGLLLKMNEDAIYQSCF